MGLLEETRNRCPELAEFLADCCERDLRFDGPYPIQHSAYNHIHLATLEYWADRHGWIDLGYRTAFAQAVLARWRARLKAAAPYRRDGFRLYLYEDMAPTLSVVAETAQGCPYGGVIQRVESIRQIMAIYAGRSWIAQFGPRADFIAPERVLSVIAGNSGSISQPSAQALGLSAGALRLLIEQYDLTGAVNAIRKRHHRRPARFRGEMERQNTFRMYEEVLAPGYA